MKGSGVMAGAVLVAAMLGAGAPPALAQDSSSALAARLGAAMKARNLDALAVRDPASPNRYIAAMHFPGVQLLVVAGEYPQPAYLDSLIEAGKHADAYVTLQQGAVPATKIFFHDMGADGLTGDENNVDILYEQVTRQTTFNRQWKAQGLSERAYREKVTSAEAAYRSLLAPLAAAAAPTPSAGGSPAAPSRVP